jgi:hypothetical protein
MWHEATKLILVSLMAFASAQPASSKGTNHSVSQFAGTWEGEMNGQPAVQVTLTTEGGRVGGTIVFYFQRLGKDGKWHVEGDNRAQPLIGPQVDGNILTFEVLHHKTHGSSELGPNKKYRLEVTAEDVARLREAGDSIDIQGHGLKLTRKVKQ